MLLTTRGLIDYDTTTTYKSVDYDSTTTSRRLILDYDYLKIENMKKEAFFFKFIEIKVKFLRLIEIN